MMNLLINILCVVQLVTVINASTDIEPVQAVCKQQGCCYPRNFPNNRIIEMSYKVEYSGNFVVNLYIFPEHAKVGGNRGVYYDEPIGNNTLKHATLQVTDYQEVLVCVMKWNNKKKEAINKVKFDFQAVLKKDSIRRNPRHKHLI